MATTKTTTLKKERPTPEQIEALKKKHGKLMRITVPEDDMICILREPGMKEVEKATAASKKVGALPYDFNRSIIQDCVVYSDEGFMSDDKRMMTLFEHLDKFRITKESSVEEL